MGAKAFPDRQDRLFGRRDDRDRLVARARSAKGLTAVLARPQAGKTWLLQEVGRYLTEDAAPPLLVGYAEQLGQTSDLLLRAVADLYGRWLEQAGAADQARRAWAQQQEGLFGRTATAITKILKEATPKALKPVAVFAEEAIGGLLAADQKLRSGGLALPKLDYDLAQELVGAVAALSGRRVVLILDAWEQSPDCTSEAKTIAAILRDLDAWPEVHIVVGSRPEHPAAALIEAWAGEFICVTVEPLDRLTLDDQETARLLAYIRRELPAERIGDGELLRDIDEHAGVIGRWTDRAGRKRLADTGDFAGIARDAHDFRYREFKTAFPALADADLKLATRLALLPMTADPDLWPRLAPVVIGGTDATRLDHLVEARILQQSDPPGFGHAKRYDAALAWLLKNRKLTVRDEAEPLILTFAAQVRDVSPETALPAAALRSVAAAALPGGLSPLGRGIDAAAAALFRDGVDADLLLLSSPPAAAAPILAMALFCTLNDAKLEGDRARRDALLDALRALATAHPADAAVREWLAKGLVNTLNHAKAEDDLARRDALLDALRALAAAHPVDAAVREQLAMGLYNTLYYAKAEDDLARRDALLDELRALATAHPADAAVRENLAMGLFNTLYYAKAEDDVARRDALLDELRALATAHPAAAAVREQLAKGLFNTFNDAKAEDDLARRDALLDELRALAAAHPADAAVREWLAWCLLNTLIDAIEEGDPARRDALLVELRALAGAHPGEAVVADALDRAERLIADASAPRP